MNACMQWSIENFGMTYPKIRTFAKCQSLAKMEMNQHFGKTNGNLFTYKHKRERPIHTHMNISLSSPYTHAWASSILSIYTHIWPSILSTHTHIMSIDHLHTYEHTIHIHMNTSLHGQLTEMRDQDREKMERRGARETGEGDERPETFLYYLCNIQGKFYMLKMVNGWRNWGGKEKIPTRSKEEEEGESEVWGGGWSHMCT